LLGPSGRIGYARPRAITVRYNKGLISFSKQLKNGLQEKKTFYFTEAVEIRSRKCNKPVDEKDNCTGKSMETRECKIMSDECPAIHLTLQLENMIRDHLDNSHNSIMADEGDLVKCQCNANIRYNLTKFSERESNKKNKFEYFWYHNELPIDDKM
jgi:hypothetical protein